MEHGEANNNDEANNNNNVVVFEPYQQGGPTNNPSINAIIDAHLANNDFYVENLRFIIPKTLSELSLETIKQIVERPYRGPQPNCIRVFHDCLSYPSEYHWLLPGWVVEERTVASGRLYKLYYSPDGSQHKTRSEVQIIFERSGLGAGRPQESGAGGNDEGHKE